MINRGVYAASLSVLNKDLTLDVASTIKHAENLINQGLHGVFFFGSTGQSQLISVDEKKKLISKIANNTHKEKFFLGTGVNSLRENLNLIKYSMQYKFDTFLIMPPAYYKGNSDEGIIDFYKKIIFETPEIKIILYNFEKLSGYKFSIEAINKLTSLFPDNIIGVKDSSYNLFDKLKIKNFLVFPGSETKLLQGLSLGCSGCISAVTNVTHSLARKVFDDFNKNNEQKTNNKLILVRKIFDDFNLISALHSFHSINNERYRNLLPPLKLLLPKEEKKLLSKLDEIKFSPNKKKGIAA